MIRWFAKFKCFFLLSCLILSTGCMKKNSFEAQLLKEMAAAHISYDVIYNFEIKGNNIILFYEKDHILNEGVFTLNNNKWKWLSSNGGVEINSKEGLTYAIVNKGDVPYNILYGTINDLKIDNVRVNSEYAKIIYKDNLKIWYILSENTILTKDIEGLSANKVIFNF